MIRVSSAFVIKWNEAMHAAGASGRFGHDWEDMRRPQVEDFIDRIKYDLAEVLMPAVVQGSEISFDKSKKVLDSNPGEEHTPQAG
jgi:hypothetical protein